ncbi:hypothetical protein Pelo_18457 [Pelomyxa schiedti]|nr:hypothetical protein Pelo_18457 [Pelomyxa schiedti]
MGAHLVKKLWDEWVVGCQRVIVVVAVLRKLDAGRFTAERVSLRFGVCPLIMGITSDVVVVRRESLVSEALQRVWIDENRLLQVMGKRNYGVVHVNDTRNGTERVFGAFCPANDQRPSTEANGKWLVQMKRLDRRFSVWSLEEKVVEEPPVGVVVEIPYPYSSCKLFTLNKVNLSEAVMVVVNEAYEHYLVVWDISQSYSTKTLHILSTILLGDFSSPPQHFNNLLVIHDQNKTEGQSGQKLFIVDAQDDNGSQSALFCVQPNGVKSKLYRAADRKFSRLDIWDCKNAMKQRHQVVTSLPQACSSERCVMTGGGFLFITEDDGRYLQVLEGSSGLLAVSFELVGWSIRELCQTSSLLW